MTRRGARARVWMRAEVIARGGTPAPFPAHAGPCPDCGRRRYRSRRRALRVARRARLRQVTYRCGAWWHTTSTYGLARRLADAQHPRSGGSSMTVYVDDARIRAQVGRITARWSHLTADTQAELHQFAARIGLRRSWFQAKTGGRWHYDVTDSKRAAAIAAGAQQVSFRDMPAITRKPGREGVREGGHGAGGQAAPAGQLPSSRRGEEGTA